MIFLYRDELYNPETTDTGTAEVLLAKHRNGPTGKTRLAFQQHYTRLRQHGPHRLSQLSGKIIYNFPTYGALFLLTQMSQCVQHCVAKPI